MKNLFAASVAALVIAAAGIAPAAAQSLLDGGYVGAAGGYGMWHAEPTNTTTGTVEIGADGFTGGVFAGWGTSFDNFYVGLEGAGDFSNIESTMSDGVNSLSLNRTASIGVSGRAGFLPSESTLLFVSAGLTTTRYESIVDDGVTVTSDEDWFTGYRLGAGVETLVVDNVFARVSHEIDIMNDNRVSGLELTTQVSKIGLGFRF